MFESTPMYGFNPYYGQFMQQPSQQQFPQQMYQQPQYQMQNQMQRPQPVQQMPAPMQPQAAPPVVQPVGDFDFVRVGTIKDIKEAYVERGRRQWFMLQNDPVIAMKFVDNAGITDTKYFKISPFDPESEPVEEHDAAGDKYVPMSAFEELSKRISRIDEQVAKFTSKEGVRNGKPAERSVPVQQPTASSR